MLNQQMRGRVQELQNIQTLNQNLKLDGQTRNLVLTQANQLLLFLQEELNRPKMLATQMMYHFTKLKQSNFPRMLSRLKKPKVLKKQLR